MKIWLLGGTSEGKELSRLFSHAKMQTVVTVAGAYGAQLIEGLDYIKALEGKLDCEQMEQLIKDECICCIVDATHPYAAVVSNNAKEASKKLSVPYIRVFREKTDIMDAIECENARQAVEYLSLQEGNILLTTGANTASEYTAIKDFKHRVFVRVLPDSGSIIKCEHAGYSCDNIIAMKGPFSYEMNLALLKMTNARFMVTKDGGKAGQVLEKLQAASDLGVKSIVIKRPEEEIGISINEAFEWAKGHFKPENNYRFPIFIELCGKKAVIIGGGAVAIRRAEVLKQFGAEIYIIAPELKGDIKGINHIKREYKKGDLEGAAIAVAATDNRQANALAALEAKMLNVPISCADDPKASTFHFPAIIKNNIACAGLITGNPAKTKRIAAQMRKALEEVAQHEREL